MDGLPCSLLVFSNDKSHSASQTLEYLKKAGYRLINTEHNKEDISTLLAQNKIDLILFDIDLPDSAGKIDFNTIKEITNLYNAPIIFWTYSNEIRDTEIEDIKSYGFISKNSPPGILTSHIKTAINLHRSRSGNDNSTYKALVDNASECIFIAQDDMLKLINPAVCKLTGYSEDKLYSTPFSEFIYPEDREKILENYKKRIESRIAPDRYSFRIITARGEIKWVEISSILYIWNGNPATLNFLSDITERKKIEDALKESEKKFRNIFENVQDIFYQTDTDGKIIEISPSIKRYSGFSREELLGKPVTTVYSNPSDREKLIHMLNLHGEISDYEVILCDKFGKEFFVSTNSHLLYDNNGNLLGVEGSLRDITARKKAELALKESLLQKEILMKELQHRVKNNLGIISSLLSLEMQNLTDENSKNIFNNAINRILSMSAIYEQLYSSGKVDNINLKLYIRDLAIMLLDAYHFRQNKINLALDLEEICLDLRRTVPLGLILNELVTNSIKYAFKDKNSGDLNIVLKKDKDIILLTVKDNGIGLPSEFDISKTTTMGLSLVKLLVTQLNGNIEVSSISGHGTEIKIRFNYN